MGIKILIFIGVPIDSAIPNHVSIKSLNLKRGTFIDNLGFKRRFFYES